MRCFSAVLVLVLLSYGCCQSPENITEGVCEVTGTTAICGEVFKWPEDARITEIVVRSAQLTRIEKNDLTKYENLETLDVSNSGLLHIDIDAFKSNEKLVELNLSGNKEFKIPLEGSFISSKSLTHLNLSHSAIEELPKNVFNDLPNLQVIDLTSTTIKDFSSLSTLEHLERLQISENSALNKTALCHETHLHQIIEIEDDKTTTFNCSEKTNEVKGTTVKQDTVTLPTVPENNENHEDKKESETTVAPATEPPNTEIVTEPIQEANTSAHENDHPEDLAQLKLKIPESNNSTDASETPKEETKDETENTEEQKKIEEPNPETKTEAGVTQKVMENEETTTTGNEETGDLDSLIRFENISSSSSTPTTNDESTHNDHKKDAEEGKPEEKTAMSQPSAAESSGVNIVLGIILCVVVVGAVGFGYKYWKNRRGGYSNANTEDVEEGKELQNMVSHRAANGESEQN